MKLTQQSLGTAPADGGGWNTDNWNDGGATGSAPFNDGFGEATNNGFGEPTNGFDAQDGGMENLGGADGACRNCGEGKRRKPVWKPD